MLASRILFVILTGIFSTAQCGLVPSPSRIPSKGVQSTHLPDQYSSPKSRPPLLYDVSRIRHQRFAHGINLYSSQDEQLLGNRLATVIEQHSQIISDPLIVKYLRRLEETISRNSDAQSPIKIKVVRDVEVNAYSLPGGFIYVQGGLVLATENEAQLVAALSHEAAHIAGRHFTRLVTQQRVWKWSLLVATGPLGYLLNRKAVPIFLARSLRSAELEADLLGLQNQYASGYDPTEFVNLINNISSEQQKPTFADRVRDSHPPLEVRIRRAQGCIRNYLPPRPEAIVDTSQFQEFKARVTELMGWSR